MNTTTKCINGILKEGDLVISTPDDDYACLIGRVTKINLLGTPEHDAETDNDTDDVHVNFLEFEYSKNRIKEIEDELCGLYSPKKDFDDCGFDDVIIDPCCLIRITDIEETSLKYLLKSGYNAACYCYGILSGLTDQTSPDNNQSTEIKDHIFKIINSSLALAGYKIMDGDRKSVIIRHCASDIDYEIKIDELVL